MDYSVVYSAKALADLQEITNFIATDDAQVASKFANRLLDLAESLRRLPERGRRVNRWKDVRVIVLAPYLIFYRVDARASRIEILRFWHGARDPRTLAI